MREDAAVVLAGDFNSTPQSGIYEYISTGRLDCCGLNRTFLSGQSLLRREDGAIPFFDAYDWPSVRVRHQGAGTSARRFQKHIYRGPQEGPPGPATATSSEAASGSGEGALETNGKALQPGVPKPIWGSRTGRVDFWTAPTGGQILTHQLALRSAYAERPDERTTGEPAFTTYHSKFKGCVDYIFYSAPLTCVAVLEPPHLVGLNRWHGLPNPYNMSDHIYLLSKFCWPKRT
jgi:hypothetical protein